MRKKFIASLLALVMLVCALPTLGRAEIINKRNYDGFIVSGFMSKEEEEEEGWDRAKCYLTVHNYVGDKTNLVIPETIDGYTVRWVYSLSKAKKVKSVTIPKTVEDICISDAPKLTKVSVAKDNPKYSAKGSFLLSKDGKTLLSCAGGIVDVKKIPDSVTTIESAFNGSKVGSVKLGKNVKTIGIHAFRNCKKLKQIDIGINVTTIDSGAFEGCDGLTQMNIGGKVKTIGNGAFWYCKNLQKVFIGSKVKIISDHAFDDCPKLKQINIGSSVTTIGRKAFSGCDGLTQMNIGGKVKTIDDSAFSYCKKLQKVVIGKSVKFIGERAFAECPKLRSVYIYNKKCEIDDDYASEPAFPKNAVIYGKKGSTAQKHAKKYKLKFKVF